MKVKKS